MAKKEDPTTSSVAFAQNYESRWVGASDGALVNINKVMDLRVVSLASLQPRKNREYFVGADIARSQSDNNNKSAFVVVEVDRNPNGTLASVIPCNIIVPPNGINFQDQAMYLKRIDKNYGVNVTVVDTNGLGQAVAEELMKESIDPLYNDPHEAWSTLNTDEVAQNENAPKKIFSLKAQGINTDIITNFIDFVESGRLKLLVPSRSLVIPDKVTKEKDIATIRTAHFQTDMLIDQISNLKLVQKTGGKLTVEQVARKTDKDIFSALAYVLYYLKMYEDKKKDDEEDSSRYFFFS